MKRFQFACSNIDMAYDDDGFAIFIQCRDVATSNSYQYLEGIHDVEIGLCEKGIAYLQTPEFEVAVNKCAPIRIMRAKSVLTLVRTNDSETAYSVLSELLNRLDVGLLQKVGFRLFDSLAEV